MKTSLQEGPIAIFNIESTLNLKSLFAALTLVATFSAAQAAPVGPLTTFAAGTPAKASEVNTNFGALRTTVNANDARIDALEAQLQKTLGFAHVVTSGTASSVGTFGGTGTTAVSVVRVAAGRYDITFTGTYPATTASGKIVLLSTATSSNFQVTNSVVDSANSTTIVVTVFAWTSNTGALADDSFDVLVLLGN